MFFVIIFTYHLKIYELYLVMGKLWIYTYIYIFCRYQSHRILRFSGRWNIQKGCSDLFQKSSKNGRCQYSRLVDKQTSIFLNIFGWSYQPRQIGKILTFKVIFYVKNYPNLSKKNFIGEYQFRSPTFVKTIFW